MRFSPVTSATANLTVGAASLQFATTLESAARYLFVSSTNCYILQAVNPTAAAGTSMFVPAGVLIVIDGALGIKLAVIQATTGGTASLTRARQV